MAALASAPAALALLLPAAVVYLGVTRYQLLIACFFTWASLHVLHQVIDLTDCYRRRTGIPEPLWSRMVDYGLVLTGLYPIGIYKIAQGRFRVVGNSPRLMPTSATSSWCSACC